MTIPPDMLADTLTESVHTGTGISRPAKAVRSSVTCAASSAAVGEELERICRQYEGRIDVVWYPKDNSTDWTFYSEGNRVDGNSLPELLKNIAEWFHEEPNGNVVP